MHERRMEAFVDFVAGNFWGLCAKPIEALLINFCDRGEIVNLLVGSLIIGLHLSLLAIGVYISFRIFDFPDISVDGTYPLGAAVAAVLIVKGVNPVWATVAGTFAGCAAGFITGILHTKFKIHRLLSGILVMTGLYSVNLFIMGKSNISLMSSTTLSTYASNAGKKIFGDHQSVNCLGWNLSILDASVLFFSVILIVIIAWLVYRFFRSEMGTAMRATGDNPKMIRALGTNTSFMIIIGLGLSNALVALSGALQVQFQGFADVQMGIGMIVWGFASVIIGQALVRTKRLGPGIAGAIMGTVLFRLIIAIVIRFGMNPNNMKLITAVFVFFALILPGTVDKIRKARKRMQSA
jgi:putative tryptophan/tyrosine transport system permease protein